MAFEFDEYNKQIYKDVIALSELNEQMVICMSGIPGSGKSTFSKIFEDKGFVVISKDKIRLELARKDFGEDKTEVELDNVLQNYSKRIYSEEKKIVDVAMAAGKSIIFDATHLTVHSRRSEIDLIRQIDKKVPIHSIVIDCPEDIAKQHNEKRATTVIAEKDGKPIYGRYVPDFVIESMAKSITLPNESEGFNSIHIIHIHKDSFILDNAMDKLKEIYACNSYDDIVKKLEEFYDKDIWPVLVPSMKKCIKYNQNNFHHKLQLHEHMAKAADYVKKNVSTKDNFIIFIATLFHDIGKPSCRQNFARIKIGTDTFKLGEKVEIIESENGYIMCTKYNHDGYKQELLTTAYVDIDTNSHYYNHEAAGAIIARRELSRIGFTNDELDKIYKYIRYHMEMHKERFSQKTLRSYESIFDKEFIEDLYTINCADKFATDCEVTDFHSALYTMLKEKQ